MEQHILVGLYIGSGAASAAVMLSDKKDRAPTQITWPFRRKSTIPLRVLYEDRDAEASFRWGDQVEEANADTLFGICAFTDPFYSDDEDLAGYRRLVDQLHGKRGKQYYHLPWSVYADLSSISDAQLMLFIRAVKQHVLDSLTQIYSEG
ncbi:hypothetical protein BU26DRAFT_235449 [Trematosphaeria pertusa]|uniref:Uncharacterized protein n=1 Tax=Trematosphaeria pertusa TaxID=390896 RepID=A0A6A6IWT0_9PLEO|nr:uncharacterized protein BU26DRAFT_235449 [Trematosphaeria pertusa]KAF2254080.1 hypothetical protein BU26DRAFT_235449 [Trematosphaeria pertusa]